MIDTHKPNAMGEPLPRVDGIEKVTGRATFTADVPAENLAWAKTLRSPHPHARIVRIDTTKAAALPGVYAVLTGEDVAGLRFGRRVVDIPLLADGVVRFVGDQVAAVVAVDEEVADRALALIDVDYEVLPAVFDAAEAMLPSAPLLHPDMRSYQGIVPSDDAPSNVSDVHVWGQGDIDVGFREAEVVVENTFILPVVHQLYMESHACQASIGEQGRLHIWANNKTPYNAKWQVAAALGIEPDDVLVHPVTIGGDFGGKGSPMNMALCCFLARQTGRPVRMVFDYGEELLAANPRHSAVVWMRTGARRDGTIVAQEATAVFNGGAYAGFKPRSFLVGAAAAGGPYRISHTRITAHTVYTNRVPCGHMRGPGEAQTMFALESQLDMLAVELGMDPAQLRRHNVVREGDATALGHVYQDVRAVETLDAALDASDYATVVPHPQPGMRYGRGVAIADRPPGGGEANAEVEFLADGTVLVSTPVFEQGSGTYTLLTQVVMETLGVSADQVRLQVVDTDRVRWDSGVGANRVARIATQAAFNAAVEARTRLFELAEQAWGWEQPAIELHNVMLTRTGSEEASPWPELITPGVTSAYASANVDESGPAHVTSFTAQVAEVAVDIETGQVTLVRLTSAHDVGRIINPLGHQGQINGGAVMGIGYGMLEELPIDGGHVTSLSMAEVKMPNIADLPELRTVLVEGDIGVGPYQIKSIGEAANGPVPAAIANAIANAVGVRIKELPLTAERVLAAIRASSVSPKIQ
jgi:CO/xanthine dehydrogenase Mo-binding subunit